MQQQDQDLICPLMKKHIFGSSIEATGSAKHAYTIKIFNLNYEICQFYSYKE